MQSSPASRIAYVAKQFLYFHSDYVKKSENILLMHFHIR